MTTKEINFPKAVRKKLVKLPQSIHIRVVEKIDLLLENPLLGVKLHGELSDEFKLRVGDYRIVYKFDKITKVVTIINIEHRQGVYK